MGWSIPVSRTNPPRQTSDRCYSVKTYAVVKGLSVEVEEAERKYAEEDEELVREFVALRDDLVGLAPEAGRDAAAEYPGRREPFDPAEADRWRAWSFTLANFDAIATGREEQMIEER